MILAIIPHSSLLLQKPTLYLLGLETDTCDQHVRQPLQARHHAVQDLLALASPSAIHYGSTESEDERPLLLDNAAHCISKYFCEYSDGYRTTDL